MRVFVAGHRGMVGGAILRQLEARQADGERIETIVRSRAQLDLTNQTAVRGFMTVEKPDVVILAAAKVGGIHANNIFPADFIYENLMIECNVTASGIRSWGQAITATRFFVHLPEGRGSAHE